MCKAVTAALQHASLQKKAGRRTVSSVAERLRKRAEDNPALDAASILLI